MTEKNLKSMYIKAGIVMTILAAITYPLYYYWKPGIKIELVVMLIFSISLAISNVGIYNFLKLHEKRPCLELGYKLGIISALVFAMAGTLKLSIETPLEGILVQGDQSFINASIDRIFMSFSFLWKMLFGLGLVLLAITGFSHPRLGKIIPAIGVFLGLLTLVLNIYSFPYSPEEINLVGLGPLVPVWHLLVALIILLAGNWTRGKLSEE